MANKTGRPKHSKKDYTINVRLDSQTQKMLEYCSHEENVSKSDIIRSGVEKIYHDIKGGKIE